MARMYPDDIEDYETATAGEKRVFRFLKEAARPHNDYVCWYEPPIGSSGKEPDFSEPVILRKGSTVEDAGYSVHKDFVKKMKFARIWGSEKYQGQMVKRDYVLHDGDVIEFHI